MGSTRLPAASMRNVQGAGRQRACASHRVVERLDGALLHHDGGLEARGGLRAGLVGRADLAVFGPTASRTKRALTKRLCKPFCRPFVGLRRAGRSRAIAMLGDVPQVVAEDASARP